MKRFLFGSEVHDEACRIILQESPMGKNVRLSFRKEPSFFLAEKISNTWSQLVVLCDDENDRVLGFGVRSGRACWLNGQAVELGYISQLRLIPEFRNGLYLAKGYRKFKELHEQDGKVLFYVTTVLSDNETARLSLESKRVGLPTYRPLDELSSYFFLAQKASLQLIGNTNPIDIKDVLTAYNEEVRDGSLATRYDENTMSWMSMVDYEAVNVHTSTFTARAVLVDFSKVKQVVIDGYSMPYSIITKFARMTASFLGIIPPPKVGSLLKCIYLTAVSISGDKEEGFQALLKYVRDKAFQKSCHGVVCGLSSQSSFKKHANCKSISNTKSILYAVAWNESVIPKIDNSTNKINIEVATL